MVCLYYNKVRAGVGRLRRLGFGLPRTLWVVQLGIFLNYFGWGSVMPFEVIYLHDGRGFGLGIAGLVVGVVTGLAVVGAPVSGPLIDRVGSRPGATPPCLGRLARLLEPWRRPRRRARRRRRS